MKGCICHFTKWQIHPFISKGRGGYTKKHSEAHCQVIKYCYYNLFRDCIAFYQSAREQSSVITRWQIPGIMTIEQNYLTFKNIIPNVYIKYMIQFVSPSFLYVHMILSEKYTEMQSEQYTDMF